MKFNCNRLGDYVAQKACDKWVADQEWHPWFAWYPVKLEHGDCRWFEIVQTRKVFWDGYFESGWEWEYKAND